MDVRIQGKGKNPRNKYFERMGNAAADAKYSESQKWGAPRDRA